MTFDPLESGPRALRPVQHPSQVKSDFSEKNMFSLMWISKAQCTQGTRFFQRERYLKKNLCKDNCKP